MITIDYNLSKEYCSDWTAISALREIVQNALDSNEKYKCEVGQNFICVSNEGEPLTPEVFSMGMSVKQGDAIGKYGEGFKIAMFILTREGHEPSIITGDMQITGEFATHPFTKVETFRLVIKRALLDVKGVSFACAINDIDVADLKEKITPFADIPLPKVRNKLEILPTKPGMIYVNGLFVCKNEELSMGYNFSPNFITLNRDRNMVDGVEYQLAQYYGRLGEGSAAQIFNLVENDARDVASLGYYLNNDKLKAELARLFYNKYGEAATIQRNTGYYGGMSGVACSYSQHAVYSECGIGQAKEAVKPDSPLGILMTFQEKNKKLMRRDLRKSVDTLVKQAKNWRR